MENTDLMTKDFIHLYTKVHKLHNELFHTWLEAWEDNNTHYLRLGNEEEFSQIIIEHVYLQAYNYLLEKQAEAERENIKFQKGWDNYEPTPLSLKNITLKKVAV